MLSGIDHMPIPKGSQDTKITRNQRKILMSLPGDTSGRLNSFKTTIWTTTVGRSYFVSHFFETRVSQKSDFFFSLSWHGKEAAAHSDGRLCCCHIVQSRLLSLSSFSGRTNSWFDLQQGMVIVSDDCRYKNGQEPRSDSWGRFAAFRPNFTHCFCWKMIRLTRLSVLIILFRISFFHLCGMNQFAKMYLQAELRNRKVGDVDGFFFFIDRHEVNRKYPEVFTSVSHTLRGSLNP